jgi:hypothetical protein
MNALYRTSLFVIAGLDPAIHAELSIYPPVSMDARVKPAHDGGKSVST